MFREITQPRSDLGVGTCWLCPCVPARLGQALDHPRVVLAQAAFQTGAPFAAELPSQQRRERKEQANRIQELLIGSHVVSLRPLYFNRHSYNFPVLFVPPEY